MSKKPKAARKALMTNKIYAVPPKAVQRFSLYKFYKSVTRDVFIDMEHYRSKNQQREQNTYYTADYTQNNIKVDMLYMLF